MEFQVGVKILIQNKEGKFLLLKRNPQIYPGARGGWDIPGGRIIPGVSLLENLSRELKEETGLDLEGEPQLIGAQDIFVGDKKHIIRLTYIGKAKGEVVLSEEHTDFDWFTKEEIQKLGENLDFYLAGLLQRNLL